MPPPAVALFTSYPLAQPRSGGQLRAEALARHYEASGFSVSRVGLYAARAFPRQEQGPLDVEFPLDAPATFADGKVLPASDDLQSGLCVARTDALFQKVVARLPERVDVFHLEQPWALPVVQRLRTLARFRDARLVYGSQNVEAPLKAAICAQRGLDARVVALVEQTERQACALADVVLAVSSSDAEALAAMGARKLVLAPNGIWPSTADAREVERWRRTLGGRRVALFVGSGHPPNAAGFVHALGDALGFVPPDAVIVAAGRVGQALEAHYAKVRWPSLVASRLLITGELDDAGLAALKALASLYLLPIFEGGGSNIKTSEAILSGREIIATSVSLRGFDRYLQLPELTVADEPEDWARAVREHLVRPEKPAAPVDALRAALVWDATLATVAPAVREVLA